MSECESEGVEWNGMRMSARVRGLWDSLPSRANYEVCVYAWRINALCSGGMGRVMLGWWGAGVFRWIGVGTLTIVQTGAGTHQPVRDLQ